MKSSLFRFITGMAALLALAAPVSESFAGTPTTRSWKFDTTTKFPVGHGPVYVVKSDFNKDGKEDLAVLNFTDHTVSVLMGDGKGKFSPKVEYPVGGDPLAIAVADLNRDGIQDLVVSEGQDGNISVLLGKADGAFQPKVDYAAGGNCAYLVVADLNHDGRLDVAVANHNVMPNGGASLPSAVTILIGKGDGTFDLTKTDSFKTGLASWGVAAADFNKDGKVDLAVSNYDKDGTVSILYGRSADSLHPNVNFDPKADLTLGFRPNDVVVSDINHDGYADLVVPNFYDHNVSVLLYDGAAGGFKDRVNYVTVDGPTSVAVTDMDGDGKLDLVVSCYTGQKVSVFLGNGDGTFQNKKDFMPGAGPSFLVVGDFNRDGAKDVVTTDYSIADISLMPGLITGHGVWGAAAAVNSAAGRGPDGLAAADFNGDGKPDLAVTNTLDGTLSALTGNGDGSFKRGGDFTLGGASASVAGADFNHDGKMDVVAVNEDLDTVSLLLGNGAAQFLPRQDFPVGARPVSVAVGDLNFDGNDDIVVADHDGKSLSVLLGDGAGGFLPRIDTTLIGAPSSVMISDVNRDGRPELVATIEDIDKVEVLTTPGDGHFVHSASYVTGDQPSGVTVGDFNHDGVPDLAVSNFASDSFSMLLGKSDGTFDIKVDFATGDGPASIVAVDLDADGNPDVLTANHNGDSVSMLKGKGDKTFQNKVDYPVGDGPERLVLADFNNDLSLDIAVSNSISNNVSTLLGSEAFLITTGANASGHGKVTPPTGYIAFGKSVAITAVPDPGYRFSGWSGDYTGPENPHTITVDKNLTFTASFTPGPYIGAINPNQGVEGDVVTVDGLNFGSSPAAIYVGTVRATSIVSWTGTKVIFKVPSGVPFGHRLVKVQFKAGVASAGVDFNLLQANITALSRTSAAPGQPVTITGANFGPTGTVSLLPTGVSKPKALVVRATSWSGTSVTFTVPGGAKAGSYKLTVKNSSGASNELNFTVAPAGSASAEPVRTAAADTTPPTSSITVPPDGTALPPALKTYSIKGAAVDTGGVGVSRVQVSITSGGSASWRDVTAGTTSWRYDWALPATEGIYHVQSRATDGSGNVETPGPGINIKIDSKAAYIQAVAPDKVVGGGAVTLGGLGFGVVRGTLALTPALRVRTSGWNNTAIIFAAPTRAPAGIYHVRAITKAGVQSNTVAFNIMAPTITSFSPDHGAVGALVTITGDFFGARPSVTLTPKGGGRVVRARATRVNATTLRFPVPRATAGQYDLKVANAHGVTVAGTFTVE